MLTLAELLRDLDLGLLAGEAQADTPVRWVHISELLKEVLPHGETSSEEQSQ